MLFMGTGTSAQVKETISAQLGYPPDARLLIVHADDVGVTQAENAATISAHEMGAITSSSMMVPCPWFPEIAAYARRHPETDFGLHLTLTAEWNYYKWGGVAPSDKIPSITNDSGYFYESERAVIEKANLAEVEKELRAQIDKALFFGISPTHLDSHMNTLYDTPEFFNLYLKVAKAYRIPAFVPVNWLGDSAVRKMARDYPITANAIQMDQDVPIQQWQETYDRAIKKLKPGLNVLVVHLAFDNDEMKAVTAGKDNWWDAPWRQRDYDYVTSRRFKELLRENNIRLVTWNQIKKVMYPQ